MSTVSSASQSGAVEVYEQDMIEGVLDLQRSQVQQIMTPRVELVAVDASTSLAELLDVTMRSKCAVRTLPHPSAPFRALPRPSAPSADIPNPR